MKRLAVLLVAVVLAVGLIGSCSEAPLESALGPSSGMIDSVAWKAQMADRPGLFLSETMTDCGTGGGVCTFDPTNYHCGGTKVECSFQGQDIITIPTTMTPKTLIVSGSGALLCNSTMGKVTAYAPGNIPIETIDMAPISPGDCGEDNITFGATATFSWEGGITHIVIEPPSPWTFPVQGGGTGIASAFYSVQMNDEAIPFIVTCTPATPVRADSVTCTATKANQNSDATVTNWKWTSTTPDGFSFYREADKTATTWTGQIVGNGYVEVEGTLNGAAFPVPAKSNNIVTQPRNWSAVSSPVVLATPIPSGLTQAPRGVDGELGLHRGRYEQIFASVGFVSDGGPNTDFTYFTASPIRIQDTVFINEAMDVGGTFYLHQETDPGKRGNLPKGGGKIWWCGRSSVLDLRTIIQAHEGTQWQSQPASHTAIFNRVTDSLVRSEVEAWGSSQSPPASFFESIRRRAFIQDSLMDHDIGAINNFRWDDSVRQQVILRTNPEYKCRFKFF